MPDPVTIAILAGISLLAFTVAGLAGFGSGVIALPVLVWMLGPREAVPIITLVQLVGSASRTGLNWKEISWPVLKWSALGSIPISALASYLFVVTPAPIFTRLLGLLLLVLVAQRHTPMGQRQEYKAAKLCSGRRCERSSVRLPGNAWAARCAISPCLWADRRCVCGYYRRWRTAHPATQDSRIC